MHKSNLKEIKVRQSVPSLLTKLVEFFDIASLAANRLVFICFSQFANKYFSWKVSDIHNTMEAMEAMADMVVNTYIEKHPETIRYN